MEQGQPPIDQELWKTARKRVAFRYSMYIYLAVNAFLWFVWYMTLGDQIVTLKSIWPLWSTLGWGLGLYFMYLNAYKPSGNKAVQKEYEKLKNKAD